MVGVVNHAHEVGALDRCILLAPSLAGKLVETDCAEILRIDQSKLLSNLLGIKV